MDITETEIALEVTGYEQWLREQDVLKAIDRVLDYSLEDERRNDECCSEALRPRHIYKALRILAIFRGRDA